MNFILNNNGIDLLSDANDFTRKNGKPVNNMLTPKH